MNTQACHARSIKLTSGNRLQLPSGYALLRKIKLWHSRARQRRHLAQLPPEMLKDIGVTRVDALNEANKPFWRS